MAATASFKQQCPSCEAWVPIRDPNLIGKKIDCPKCKYRFVVEDPGTEAEEEAESPVAKAATGAKRAADGKSGAVKGKGGPRRRDQDEEEGKAGRGKGAGGSTKLIVGVGLGVVAVGALAVVGFLIMNSDNKSKPPTQPPQQQARAPAPTPAGETPTPPAETPSEEGDKPAAGATAAAAAAAALPASQELLSNLLPPDAEGICNVRMKELIRTSLGRTIFATPGAFRSEAIQQRLGLAVEEIDSLLQGWNFSKNWSFNVIHTIRPINQAAVKTALRAKGPERIEEQEYFLLEPNSWLDSLGNTTFATLLQINPAQVPARSGNRALRFFDDQTLILADLEPLKQFLAVKGRFPTKPQPKEAEANPEAAETPRPGPGPRGRGAPPGAEPPAEGEAAAPAPSGSYLTVNANLKNMLDLVDRKQPVVSLAVDTQAARRRLPPLGLSTLEALLDTGTITKLAVKALLEEAGVLGAAVQLRDGLALTLAEDCQNEDNARRRSMTVRRETGPELAKLLTAALGTPVEMEEEQNNPANAPGGDQPGAAGPATIPGRFLAPPGGRPGVLGSGMARPGAPGVPFGPSSGMGARGNLPPTPGEPEKPKPGSTIKLEGPEKTVVLLTISVTDPAVNNRLMQGKIRQLVLQQKGFLDMAGSRLRIHELGDAVRTYAEAHQAQFPRGTLERPIPTSRAGRPYEPKQRISWLAELLPHLGPEQAFLYRGIDRTKSWNDPENQGAAATLVPQFLNPNYPPNTWWVRYPDMTQATAATHYVGIAGIGADAAEYSADDPATAKKLGIFGYDRATRLQDITDGVSNTIVMAQVPPTYKRPWMAGGGATVQGVLEKDSVKPLVSPQPDGKRGTLVVMADGSVRFIAENIKDDVFKALCTIKGGEKDFILDRDASPVPRPEAEAEPPPPPVQPSSPAAVASTGAGGWKEFTSKEGGFTIALPSDPTETKVSQKTRFGTFDVYTVIAQLPGNEGAYHVISIELSDALLQQLGVPAKVAADPELLLTRFSETTRGQVKANLPGAAVTGDFKPVTLNGNPGREFTLELPSKGQALIRVYVAKNRVYQLQAVNPKGAISSPDAQRFFDSFKLLDK